jgi:hypothetical protein
MILPSWVFEEGLAFLQEGAYALLAITMGDAV